MKKLLAVLLSLCLIASMCVSVYAKGDDVDIDVGSLDIEVPTEKPSEEVDINVGELEEDTPSEEVEFNVGELDDFVSITSSDVLYKTNGRTPIINNQLAMYWSGASFEFFANCSGNINLYLNAKNIMTTADGVYFSVYVDGVLQPRDTLHIVDSGSVCVTIAKDLEQGTHHIKVVRQNEAEKGIVYIAGIHLDGTFQKPPVEKKLSIEFVGDSITAAYGNLGNSKTPTNEASSSLYQDATKGYAYLTATALNADYSIVAQQGIGAKFGYKKVHMDQIYSKTCLPAGDDSDYAFTDQPDIVVICLGTNDVNIYNDTELKDNSDAIKAGFADILNQVRTKNPNAKIVWMYGMMTARANSLITSVIEEAGGAQSNCFAVGMDHNTDGANSHPNAAAHAAFAEKLTEFISQNVFEKMVGDVDGNKAVNLKDAVAISQYVAGYDSGMLVLNADVNEDKSIDLKDTVKLVRDLVD